MSTKAQLESRQLEAWQVEDARRLKALFNARKAHKKMLGETFTQETFAEQCGLSSAAMVWQYLNAHRPLNIQAAAAFARCLEVPVGQFSPTLEGQIALLAESPAKMQLVRQNQARQLQFVDAREALLLSEFRACAEEGKVTALGFVSALPKVIRDTVADER